MKSKISLLPALLMIAVILVGCSTGPSKESAFPVSASPTDRTAPSGVSTASDAPVNSSDLSLPIVSDGSVTLKIWYPLSSEVSSRTDNLADGTNYAWSEAMKRTGIHIAFIHPASTNEAEQFQLMIASQDYPDIFKGFANVYTGGPDRAVEDKVYLKLNDLLSSYAPNYMKWVNSSDTNRKNAITDSGNMVCVSQVYDRVQPAFLGYAIRQDWLDDLGLKRPETYNEWYYVLTQFKREKTTNGAGPLELASTGVPLSSAFSGGYGVAANYFIQKDGQVLFSQTEPGFREYLEMMARWYNDGLVDKDFITNGSFGIFPNNTRIANNETGADAMMYTYAGDYLARIGVAEEGANFTLTKWPVKEAGTNPPVAMKGYGEGELLGGAGAMVFSTCKYPEYAVRFIDFFYSEEGALLANYGIEGVTFNYMDGKPIQTELITKNSDGMTTTKAQERYLIHNGFMVFMLDREENVQSQTALEYREYWAPLGEWNIVGNLTYAAEEGTERAGLLNDIQTYVNEMTCKFIMGAEELNDTTWNNYLAQVKSMNIDRVVDLTQAAYDRYKAR